MQVVCSALEQLPEISLLPGTSANNKQFQYIEVAMWAIGCLRSSGVYDVVGNSLQMFS
jgi:hypothetical protein